MDAQTLVKFLQTGKGKRQKMKQPTKRDTKKEIYNPTPVDYHLLRYLKDYHFLTARLFLRRHFEGKSLERAQRIMKRLFEAEHLARRALPDVRVGQPEYIYALATKGINELKSKGETGFSRYRNKELQEFSYLHLQHELWANEFAIEAELLHRFAPDITLEEKRHGLDIKRESKYFTYERRLLDGGREEERVKITPDYWFHFSLQLANIEKKRNKYIVLELDTGSETNIREFKKKFRAYVHYAYEYGPYFEQFGTNYIQVAYATTAGEERRKTMLEWCEKELQQQRLDQDANLFRFCALPREVTIDPKTRLEQITLKLDPTTVFLYPIWYRPYDDTPAPLLWKP